MRTSSHIRRLYASLQYGFRNQKFRYVWVSLTGLVSLILCFIPLFNLLAFEFCFAMGIPLTLGGGLLGVNHAPGSYETGDRKDDCYTIFLALLAALLPICLNALRIENCNFVMGLYLFVLFPTIGTFVAWCWGSAIGSVIQRRPRLTFVLVWVVSIVFSGSRFLWYPPVDLFNSLLGYWPGAIYDDVFQIDRRIIMSRFEDITIASSVLAASLLFRACYLTTVKKLGLFSLLIVIVGTQHGIARKEGVYRDAEFIQNALGGHHKTEHFDIYYPESWSQARIEKLGFEFEFAHHRLSKFFQDEPKERISAYLYADMNQKKALMGARRTRIAKPWQWAFHIHKPRVGQDVIVHEMAHVFAAQLGEQPHRLSLGPYGLPNMGIIEGVAEAATWPQGQLDLHQWSAAMQTLNIAPSIAQLLTPTEFYGHNARTAYTLCGSFSRFVWDQDAQEDLWNAYRTGRFDSNLADTEQREAQWREFLKTVHVPERALAEARAKFDRPSIFGRVCAREIAQLWTDFRAKMRRRDLAGSISVLNDILNHIPRDLKARQALARLHIKTGELGSAQTLAQGIVDGNDSGGVARSVARETLGDIAGLKGDFARARRIYADLDGEVFSRHRRRLLAVKLDSLSRGDAGRIVLKELSAPTSNKRLGSALEMAQALDPTWAILQYLRGRYLMATKKWTSAFKALQFASKGVDSLDIQIEIQRLIAAGAFQNTCYQQAEQHFTRLSRSQHLELTPNESRSYAIWADRSRFFRRMTKNSDFECPVEIDKMLVGIEDSRELGNKPPAR